MPKLDVRGQQQAAPAAQQVQGAYGEGIGAAMLQVGQGLKSGAKAAMDGVDFFDMLGESEARVAAAELNLEAEDELYRLETEVDENGVLKTKPEDRESEMKSWFAAKAASASEGFRGSGARFWKQESAERGAQYALKARQSARSTQLNKTRANAIREGEALVREAEATGTVDQDRLNKYYDSLDLLVERGVLDADTAARLQIRTDSAIYGHEKDWKVADDGRQASRAYYENVIEGEMTEQEALREIDDKLDPDTAAFAKSLLSRDLRLHAEQQRVERNERLDAAYDYIYQNQGELPPEHNLTGSDAIALEAAAARLRTGKQTSDLGKEAAIYFEMAQKDPEAFMKKDLWPIGLAGKISRSDFQFLRKVQDDMLAQREPTWESTPQWRANQLISAHSSVNRLDSVPERAAARIVLQRAIELDERARKRTDPSYVTTPEREQELFDIFVMSKEARLIDYYWPFFDRETPISMMTPADIRSALDDTSGDEGTLRRQVYEQLIRDGELTGDADFGAQAVTDRIEELFALVEEMRAY